MNLINALRDRVRASPYTALSQCVFVVAAYLCLVNLDYAALWHDEAPTAMLGKTLLEQGKLSGWDGRNLVGGGNGRMLNENLIDTWPPLTYVLNVVGIFLFGFNETGARIMHAIVGILSLGVFYLLLRQYLPKHPRLVFFIFLFAAWSAQLLLYFRQSRYYAFMAFGVIAAFYFYEHYWQTKKIGHLAALTLIAALSFFNHYAGGAATMLSLAAWHLLFRARETTRREWTRFAICGAMVVALGSAYLVWLGVIGGERSGFAAFTGVPIDREYEGIIPLFLLRIWIYIRELFTADWISWPVLLWFVGVALLAWQSQRKPAVGTSRQVRRRRADDTIAKKILGDDFPLAAAGKIILMGALFALFSAVLSVQPVQMNPIADLRYYVGALPLLLAMKGLFVEWAWRKSKIAGAAVLAVLLFTSAGAAPFNMTLLFTGERTLGAHLFQFIREIHQPYRDSIRVVSDYLLQNAAQDDLVYVPGFADREALTFYTGHRVQFCCALDQNSPLPRARVKALGAPLYIGENTPDWIIGFGGVQNWEKLKAHYAIAAALDVHPYPTQRPELNFHAFSPLPVRRGVYILRRFPSSAQTN